jgi:hypothetical protein
VVYYFVTQSADPQSFHGILVLHIYRLLQERESDLAHWVLDEALNASSLEVGGTFRNVLACKIDEVVIPIFAKIIACIDCSYNLDLIDTVDSQWDIAKSGAGSYWIYCDHKPSLTGKIIFLSCRIEQRSPPYSSV